MLHRGRRANHGGQAVFFFLVYYETNNHYFLPWVPAAAVLGGGGWALIWDAVRNPEKQNAPLTCLELISVVLLVIAGAKLAWDQETDYGLLAFAGAVLIVVRAVHMLVSSEKRRAGSEIRALGLAAVVCCAALIYWSNREIYWEPRCTMAAEREVVSWVNARREQGDDVAVIASGIYNIHGNWPELPQFWAGRYWIAPMGIENALRAWSPDSLALQDTVDSWEREFNVKFIVLYDLYWRQTAEPQNRVLRDYVEDSFEQVKRFDLGGFDYYSDVRIYERSAGARRQP